MKTFFFIALCLCLATLAVADVKIVQKVKSSGVMGQPPKDTTVNMLVKGRRARIESGMGQTYQIVDLDEGKVYIVDPAKKHATVMTTAMLKQTAGMMNQLTGGNQQAKPEVTRPGTTHTYNGYKCEDVKVSMTGSMLSFTSTSCISPEIDVKEFESFKEFGEEFSRAFGIDPMGGVAGFPVYSETHMTVMGQKVDSTSELVSVNRDGLPETLFLIPPDYKVQEMKMPAKKP